MTESEQSLNESLSAAIDGEADELELRRVLNAIDEDPDLRAKWQRLHLIGGVMRRQTPSVVGSRLPAWPADFEAADSQGAAADELGVPGPTPEPSAGEREGRAPRMGEPSAGEREGRAPRMKEPSAGEREGRAPRMKEPSAGEREGRAPRMKEPGSRRSRRFGGRWLAPAGSAVLATAAALMVVLYFGPDEATEAEPAIADATQQPAHGLTSEPTDLDLQRANAYIYQHARGTSIGARPAAMPFVKELSTAPTGTALNDPVGRSEQAGSQQR